MVYIIGSLPICRWGRKSSRKRFCGSLFSFYSHRTTCFLLTMLLWVMGKVMESLLWLQKNGISKGPEMTSLNKELFGEGVGRLLKSSSPNFFSWRKVFFSLSTCGKYLIQRTRHCWKTLIARRFFLSLSWTPSETHPLVLELPSATAQKNHCFSVG